MPGRTRPLSAGADRAVSGGAPGGSAVYVGTVRHARPGPGPGRPPRAAPARVFDYRLYMPYVDTAALPHPFAGSRLWAGGRWSPVRFRRSDYLGDPDRPLDDAVRDEVERLSGTRPEGPIRMLAQLRTFGWCFNPITLYYGFAPDGPMEWVLADVTNTPWAEHHTYLVPAEPDGVARATHAKALHVSPFLTMDMEHRLRMSAPGADLSVLIENLQGGRCMFRVDMSLQRVEPSAAALRRLLVRLPLMTAKVSAAIYAQAIRLRLRGVPVQPHPSVTDNDHLMESRA